MDIGNQSLKTWKGPPLSGAYQLRNMVNIVEKEGAFLSDLREKTKRLESQIDYLDSKLVY